MAAAGIIPPLASQQSDLPCERDFDNLAQFFCAGICANLWMTMAEFDFKGCSKKCAGSDREIGPGDEYISVLILNDDCEMERLDYSMEAWEGPPEDCVGWWRSKIPDLADGKVYWAPNDVIFAYFDKIHEEQKAPATLYVLALLMVRKRLMKLDDGPGERDKLRLISSRHEQPIEIQVITLTAERAEQIQQELGEHLFTNRVIANEGDGEAA